VACRAFPQAVNRQVPEVFFMLVFEQA